MDALEWPTRFILAQGQVADVIQTIPLMARIDTIGTAGRQGL